MDDGVVNRRLTRGPGASRPPSTLAELRFRLTLLGGFELVDRGRRLAVARGCQRLVAFTALHDRPVTRGVVAAELWPEASDLRAFGSLRASLARIDAAGRAALHVSPLELSLADGVSVDLRDARAAARRLLDPHAPRQAADLDATTLAWLSSDVFAGWYDDWALVAAEDWRQLRVRALEVLGREQLAACRFADAAAAARAASRADPLRESARALLVDIHLAEGNRGAAIREYDDYRSMLRAELGVVPTAQLRAVVDGVRGLAAEG